MNGRLFGRNVCRWGGLPARLSIVVALVSMLTGPAFGKMYEEPRSFALRDKSQDQVDLKVLPKVDVERLRAEDRAQGKVGRPGPQRMAVAMETAFSLTSSGTWQTLPDGRLWRLRIQSPGAMHQNLGITRFDMPEGAKLWIYDPQHTDVDGPYTSRNRSRLGSLWTPVIQGDEMVVEVFVPTGVDEPVVVIGRVNQGYRGFAKGVPGGGTEGACENDVICPIGDPWRDQIRAVGVYTLNGTAQCSGTLLNDVPGDRKPYFLSANHCAVDTTNDVTVVVYWNYQSPTCGTHGPGSTADNQSGSTFRASYAPSDFLLFELSATPDPSFNVFYAGWDATGTAPSGNVGIHHPSCDVKAISASNTAPQGADWTDTGDGGTLDPAGNHWRVDWSSGVTEHGSSGSGLFDADNKRVIGQLHGGPSACGLAQTSEHDYYGKLSVSWNGGGTPATRLKDWLDPASTGTLGLDGDPHITTANGDHYDFQGAGEFISLRDPDGLEIQTRQAPIATTFNPPADAHDGLATCVSLNTAVAARVGRHRVTYEPNLSGQPDPSGMQLRVDGTLTTLGPAGIDLGDGGLVMQTAAPGGLAIQFSDASVLFVTPTWWISQSKWYLNVDVVRPPAVDGVSGGPGSFPTGGIAGAISTDAWLPALPDGSSLGAMPAALHDRYVTLYEKFADAWRVSDKTSLFDYAPGTSTETFTLRTWPLEHPPCVLPKTTPVEPASESVALAACRAIRDKNAHQDCVFDVEVTGNVGFGKTYLFSQRIQTGATRTTVAENRNPALAGEPVTFVAVVTSILPNGRGVPTGSIQFLLDGNRVGHLVQLSNGQAVWRTEQLKPGVHKVVAKYIPSPGSAYQPSTSTALEHTIR